MDKFIPAAKRQGSCYHEFYRGKWDGVSFWKEDSILLHDDLLSIKFAELLRAAIPGYDPLGVTEVNRADWQAAGKLALAADPETAALFAEADRWAMETFSMHDRFTILGI